MLQPEEDLVLDRLIHEPGRLAILTVLSTVRDADFVFLQRATGLTKGNLSSHLTKLEDAGLVAIEKRFIRKRPNTNVALTALGKQRIAHHWDQLERLKTLSQTGPGEPVGLSRASDRPSAARGQARSAPTGRARNG
jgi:DNA-binding transcriptional ArsR family regulator